jgi:type 1 fimbriae regulatory protein FimE
MGAAPKLSAFYRIKPKVSGKTDVTMRVMDNVITLATRQKAESLPATKPRPDRGKKPIRYLTGPQVQTLIAVAKKTSRHPLRDATMILVAYRHGLRVSELVDLTWDRICLERAEIFVERLKGSKSSMQQIEGDELRELRKLRRKHPHDRFVFVSERGGPLTPDSFQYLLKRCGDASGVKAHPHMLRHGCGHHLVNTGVNTRTIQDYLGHVDLRHTERYTELDAQRFRELWRRK